MSMATANTCAVVRVNSSHPSQGAFVEINASDFDPTRHTLYTGTELPPPPVPPALPVQPPKLPNALANLPKDWRNSKMSDLRATAEKIAGRTPESRDQAIAMIEAALTGK